MRHHVDSHRPDIADHVGGTVFDTTPLGAVYQSKAGTLVPKRALKATAPDVLLRNMPYSERCLAVLRGTILLPREEQVAQLLDVFQWPLALRSAPGYWPFYPDDGNASWSALSR